MAVSWAPSLGMEWDLTTRDYGQDLDRTWTHKASTVSTRVHMRQCKSYASRLPRYELCWNAISPSVRKSHNVSDWNCNCVCI